ncbi:MAG: response regulator transcription factor [Chloroflexi bacterium]|nr:response regulator transcription factor [Chloroflexota bacterium]
MRTRVKVLIVDDHAVFAEGLSLIIESAPDLDPVGVAHTAADGLRLAAERRPDVILLDHHLPDRSGADVTAEFNALAGNVAVLILTSDASEEVLLAAFEAGAAGYLLKTKAAKQVLEAIRHAAAGETLINASTLARVLKRRTHADQDDATPRLTDRELEVLRAMAEGLDTAAIGRRLGVTGATTRTYIQNILRKLDAHSRLQAVVRAKSQRLLP